MLARMMMMGVGNYNDYEALAKFLNSHPCVAVDWIEPLVHLQLRVTEPKYFDNNDGDHDVAKLL